MRLGARQHGHRTPTDPCLAPAHPPNYAKPMRGSVSINIYAHRYIAYFQAELGVGGRALRCHHQFPTP